MKSEAFRYRELVSSRVPDEEHAHENIYVALHDAFDSIRRQLVDYLQRRQDKNTRQMDVPPTDSGNDRLNE